MAYDESNIFAKILRGEIPSQKVYEDEHSVAFLDIMPRADGHTLVVPKKPAVNIFDVTPDVLARTVETVRKLAPVVRDAFGAGGIIVQQFNGAPAGQVVFHLHFHMIPCRDGVGLRPPGKMEDPRVLEANAARIRAQLGRGGA